MQHLPEKFLEKMKEILSTDFDAFLECLGRPGFRGIRWNPLKCTLDNLQKNLPFQLTPTPFSSLSFYIPPEVERIGSLPMHHAGAFYVQEPSASSAVTVLSPNPGEKILDLCAAPGGKSTQIAALLAGEGLLWSNEYVKNRASVLLSNIERMGIENAVVSSCHPETLCTQLAGFFDKVLVDAPCSGEGMFLHDEGAVSAWSPEHVISCAARQQSILDSAAKAVAPGGYLVYSTCTYSMEENESVVQQFLTQHSEFQLVNCDVNFGRASSILPMTRRIFPMDGGDGHFVAKLQKQNGDSYHGKLFQIKSSKNQQNLSMAEDLYHSLTNKNKQPIFYENGNYIFILPEISLPAMQGLHILRAGVFFGEIKKNRIEPAHHFYMAVDPVTLRQRIELSRTDDKIYQYLRGEEIAVSPELRGYTGVSIADVMVGFGKSSNGKLKNQYPKGLRNHI